MSQDVLEILKQAILLERRGRALYRQTADHAQDAPVRKFFQLMADEEDRHVRILEQQFKIFSKYHRLANLNAQTAGLTTTVDHAMRESLKSRIAAAGNEGAAVSAAMLMEERSVSFYSDCTLQSDDPAEKALFRWLAEWEHGHLEFMTGLDRDIRERVWHDVRFWPSG